MESTDKLRNYVSAFISPGAEADLLDLADEIEREIAERYMELPVDMDGVPVKIGDMLECEQESKQFVIEAVSPNYVYSGSYVGTKFLTIGHYPWQCTHVKQRTIEDLLMEFADDVRKERVEQARLSDDVIRDYADELRNMGVGE